MRPVLETEARPDTAEARRAGESALGVGLILVLSLLAVASALMARPAPTPASPAPRTALPLTATGADAQAVWRGAEHVDGHVVVATGDENERVATIEGGSSWRDYTLRTRVRWLEGSRVSLLVRVADEASFIAAELEGTTLRVAEVYGGVRRTLATARIPDYRGRAFDAAVTVSGAEVTVSLDGTYVAAAGLARRLAGTAGLAAGDERWRGARIEAEYVRVEQPGVPAPGQAVPAGVRP